MGLKYYWQSQFIANLHEPFAVMASFKCIVFVLLSLRCVLCSIAVPVSQMNALYALYNATAGTNWYWVNQLNKTQWNFIKLFKLNNNTF